MIFLRVRISDKNLFIPDFGRIPWKLKTPITSLAKNAKLHTYDVSNILQQNYVWYLPITTLLTTIANQ